MDLTNIVISQMFAKYNWYEEFVADSIHRKNITCSLVLSLIYRIFVMSNMSQEFSWRQYRHREYLLFSLKIILRYVLFFLFFRYVLLENELQIWSLNRVLQVGCRLRDIGHVGWSLQGGYITGFLTQPASTYMSDLRRIMQTNN